MKVSNGPKAKYASIDVKRSHMELNMPLIDLKRSHMDLKRYDMDLNRPLIDLNRPLIDLKRSHMVLKRLLDGSKQALLTLTCLLLT